LTNALHASHTDFIPRTEVGFVLIFTAAWERVAMRNHNHEGGILMATIEVKNFDSPDEHRPFEGKGHADVVNIAGRVVGRGVFEPGWRWSTNVKPIAGTDSCQVSHLGYIISGRMKVTSDDGTVGEIGPGDVYALHPGHDAETIGDEPCVSLDFGEFGDYAKRH
jgi:hypothetical protein